MSKISGILPWYGAKRTLAPPIVAELSKHRAYWELFGGSFAVQLVKMQAGAARRGSDGRNALRAA